MRPLLLKRAKASTNGGGLLQREGIKLELVDPRQEAGQLRARKGTERRRRESNKRRKMSRWPNVY